MFFRSQFGRALAFLLLLTALLGGTLARVRAQEGTSSSGQTTNRPRRASDAPPSTQQQSLPQPTQKEEPTVQEDEVLRVETNLTNILFTAMDKNKRSVTTLRQEDIRVYEDGAPQEIFTFQQHTDLPLSLAILIDISGSQEYTLPEEKAAAREFVDAVLRPEKDEASVVSFTGEVVLEQGLTGNVARVRRAIENVKFVPPAGYIGGGQVIGTPPIAGPDQTLAGWTALWDAIWVTSREVLSDTSDKTRRAIILVTDGEDNHSQMKMAEAIDSALKAEAIIYSIGIGDRYHFGVDEGALRKLSERTGGRAFFPRDESDLRAAFAQIQRELREQYLIAYAPTNKKRDGSYRQVRIDIVNPELRKQNVRLTYRQGYFAKNDSSAPITPSRTRKP